MLCSLTLLAASVFGRDLSFCLKCTAIFGMVIDNVRHFYGMSMECVNGMLFSWNLYVCSYQSSEIAEIVLSFGIMLMCIILWHKSGK